jgi:hypothetical protein
MQTKRRLESLLYPRRVIHQLLPRFNSLMVDVIEEKILGYEKDTTVGLDRERLMKLLEPEHHEVVEMLSKALDYVMLSHLLNKLDLESFEQLERARPALANIYNEIEASSYDPESESATGVPKLLLNVPADKQLDTLQGWILRMTHVIRTIGFPEGTIDVDSAFKNSSDVTAMVDSLTRGDSLEASVTRSTCSSLLSVLQEILATSPQVEAVWSKYGEKEQIRNGGVLCESYRVEKTTFFCPFSVAERTSPQQAAKMRQFFLEAQVQEIDLLKLITVMLYSPDNHLRLEVLELACEILGDAQANLQDGYASHITPGCHLQKVMRFQFGEFMDRFERAVAQGVDFDSMDRMVRFVQLLCENHNEDMQTFVGDFIDDKEAEQLALLQKGEAAAKEQQDDDDQMTGPPNLAEWLCSTLNLILRSMTQAQEWQISMKGRAEQYNLITQLCTTGAETIQGPHMGNQALLVNRGLCADLNTFFPIQRKDEFAFRNLIQDNEDLFEQWMQMLKTMREAEIAMIKFLASLLEELPLDKDDPNFGQVQNDFLRHKTITIKRMVEEINPKTIADKVICHWNLSTEGQTPETYIPPVREDDVTDINDTAVPLVRPKREELCEIYTLLEQQNHCLEICYLCISLFDAVIRSPEQRTSLFNELEFDRPDAKDFVPFTSSLWNVALTKIINHFNAAVTKMHHEKYLHFLFGQVEVVRGARLQRMYFLVPEAIRVMKDHPLVKAWQDAMLAEVDRSGPEARLDDFSDRVIGQYIPFVEHMWFLQQQPWPLNVCGEMMDLSARFTLYLMLIINVWMLAVYDGAYDKHTGPTTWLEHYPEGIHVTCLQVLGILHLIGNIVKLGFYFVAHSPIVVITGMDEWREDNPRDTASLNNPFFYGALAFTFVFSDTSLQYTFMMAILSYMGVSRNFLFFSVHTMDYCMSDAIMSKVIQAITKTGSQLVGTVFLGASFQYIFLCIGFMSFDYGYGFADVNTDGCDTLMQCLQGHLDYGFRSAPVWFAFHGTTESLGMFAFNYAYNLLVILILAAVISGIIIDNFADMRTTLQETQDDMKSLCFICSTGKSTIERSGTKWAKHIYFDHYMWSYARFLYYLHSTGSSDLTGPETYIHELVKGLSFTFYPIQRSISLEASAEGEGAHEERDLKIKDLEEMKGQLKDLLGEIDNFKKAEMEQKATFDDMKETLRVQIVNVQAVQIALGEAVIQNQERANAAQQQAAAAAAGQ